LALPIPEVEETKAETEVPQTDSVETPNPGDDDTDGKPKKTVAIVVDGESNGGTLRRRPPPRLIKDDQELTKQYSRVSIFSGMNMEIAQEEPKLDEETGNGYIYSFLAR